LNTNGEVTVDLVTTAQAEVTRLTGEVTRLTGERDTAQANFDQQVAEVTRLTGEVTRLTGERDTAQANFNAVNQEITSLEQRRTRYNLMLTDYETRYQNAVADARLIGIAVDNTAAALTAAEEDLDILNLERSIEPDVYSRIDIE
jgi:chromosome segregation ATPase